MPSAVLSVLVAAGPSLRADLSELLSHQRAGAALHLTHSSSLSETCDRLHGGGIDVVLLDPSLPDGRSLDAVLAVRSAAPSVPVVVFTGVDDDAAASAAIRAGAADYLVRGRADAHALVDALSRGAERQKRLDAERRAATDESVYHLLFDQSPDAIVVIGLDTAAPVRLNHAARRLFGLDLDEENAPLLESGPEWDACLSLCRRARAAIEDGKDSLEVPFRSPDGTLRFLEASIRLFRDGDRPAVLITCRDITARRRSEDLHAIRTWLLDYAASHTLDELLQQALDEVCALADSPIGFYHFVDHDQGTLTLKAWSTRTLREFCRAGEKDAHYPIDQAGVWADCVRQRRPVIHNDYASVPNRKGTPDGHAAVVRELGVPIMRGDEVVAVLGVGNKPTPYTDRDADMVAYLADVAWEIAQRKRAQDMQARLATVINSAPYLVTTISPHGSIQSLNQAGRELLHLPADLDARALRWRDYAPDRAAEQLLREAVPAVGAGGVWHGESALRDAHGHEFPAEVVLIAHGGSDHDDGFYSVIAVDNSERVRLGEELRQAQKMEAIGRLAGGIAHDFNNLLMPILTYSQLLLDRIGPDPKLRRYVEQLVRTAEHASALPRQLLAFSRKQVVELQVLDLNAVVSEMGVILERALGEDIELSLVPYDGLWPVKADQGQVEQVILNLAVNARDAMPEGGNLTIETTCVLIDEEFVRLHPGSLPGAFVRIAVTDTGCGMTRETQARIFEPFFTTKEQGQGTGLGLATVYGIVTQFGGFVRVYSEPGQGTSFNIFLPRTEDVAATEDEGADPVQTGGSETVMVVEDDPVVRAGVCEMLAGLGYQVLDAESGAAALSQLECHPGSIDLVLTDVVMPGLSGPQVAEKIAAARPKTRILFMSGYAQQAVVRNGVLEAGVSYLQKPFTMGDLARKLRQALDSPETQPLTP